MHVRDGQSNVAVGAREVANGLVGLRDIPPAAYSGRAKGYAKYSAMSGQQKRGDGVRWLMALFAGVLLIGVIVTAAYLWSRM